MVAEVTKDGLFSVGEMECMVCWSRIHKELFLVVFYLRWLED